MPMLYPSVPELLKNINNRYLLVNVAAKRARELSEIAEETSEALGRKPVSAAIDEIAAGKIVAHMDGEG